jgi:hypothetical protein
MLPQPDMAHIRKHNPRGYNRRTAMVRFYPSEEGEASPTFVVIAGAVYRREEDQEKARLHTKYADLRAYLTRRLEPRLWRVVYHMGSVGDEIWSHELATVEKRLKDYLPQHAEVIAYCFAPEAEPEPDWIRHQGCKLSA